MGEFDLGKYWNLFPEALQKRYGSRFEAGFDRIEEMYKAVRSGARPLTVEDVISIFDSDLPFVHDWTKPDRDDLAARMESKRAAKLIADLRDRNYDSALLSEIIYCFREISLTALVLQHVYPKRFAMCSHHLASQLCITASTVPEFYLKYCKELKAWSEHEWPTPHKLTVVETEFALWTWYRRAYGKSSKQRGTHQTEFRRDHWVQERRAKQIADSLGLIDRLDLARSFLDTAPTVAAITAWREFAVKVRNILEAGGKKMTKDDSIWNRIARLPAGNVPQGWTPEGLKTLWWGRNEAVKDGEDIPGPEGTRILNGVGKFIEHNTPEPHF
jgi:hypothetical protein